MILCNLFNNSFVEIGPKLASNIYHSGKDFYEYPQNTTQNNLFPNPIHSEETINKIVNKFNQN